MRDLSLHILDIVNNSIAAEASEINIQIIQFINSSSKQNTLQINITDNGVGMDSDFEAEDPFVTTRTTRNIGLGIPMLKASVLKCGGSFKLSSQKDIGTQICADLPLYHIDRLPIGDLAATMLSLIPVYPHICFILKMKSDVSEFNLDTREITQKLGTSVLTEFAVLNWLKEYINDGIKMIFGGVLYEVDC